MSVACAVHIICREGQGSDHFQHLPDDDIELHNVGAYAAVQCGVELA